MTKQPLYTGTKRHNWLVQYILRRFHGLGKYPRLPKENPFQDAAVVSAETAHTHGK